MDNLQQYNSDFRGLRQAAIKLVNYLYDFTIALLFFLRFIMPDIGYIKLSFRYNQQLWSNMD